MAESQFDKIILLPHNTPLSNILQENRALLAKLKNQGLNTIYPIYPFHCFIDSEKAQNYNLIEKIQKSIKQCSILPPQVKNGFLYRPVAIEGAKTQGIFPELITNILPENEVSNQQEAPKGFIFGYCKDLQKIDNNKIVPIDLRVFRLYRATYLIHEKSKNHSVSWTLSKPYWVKIK